MTPGQYLNGSAALNTAGTGTTVTMPTIAPSNLASQGTPFANVAPVAGNTGTITPAKTAVLVIANPTASGQTINAGTLTFTDTVGGQTVTISYTLSSVSIAANASQTFVVALSSGILAIPKVNATFAANPSAGTLSALLVLLPF